ncbi:MAG TPA: CPBP family intramembrane glutamic endopeptidase [Anaerolineales bacterium]|nr:CPBP family intramembrane glutamic endopeptidase [Anaerolineales bacterium]
MTTISSFAPTAENRLVAFVKRHPVIAMSILTLVFAWPGLIWEALYSQGLVASQAPFILSLMIGWVPGLAAVAVSAILAGRAGVRELLGRFLIWRVGMKWYIVGFFLLAAIILGGIGLHVLFGGPMPIIPAAESPVWQIALAFPLFILVGILFNTEEIAWRGFVISRLQARYGALVASLLLVIPESLLHLPYFWNKDVDFYQTVGMFWFTAFSVAMVFIYTFVFNKTKGSLLIVTIMHASQNAWSNLLSDNALQPFQFTVALAWMIAIALIFLTKGQLGYEHNSK